MHRISSIFFDLDGTLTDSAEGIYKCAQYALGKMDGRNDLTTAELTGYIGGSLRAMFSSLLDTVDADRIELAVTTYRERYGDIGIYENKLYDGVYEMLNTFSDAGITLFVATSKTTYYSEKILKHFALDGCFAQVYGSEANGSMGDKAELLAHALATRGIAPHSALMIGDRNYDIRAANANNIRSIGVEYGYGSRAELLAEDPTFICDTPASVAQLVMRAKNELVSSQ